MKKILPFIIVASLFFGVGLIYAQTKSFPDVKTTDWFYNDVMNMVEWDVIRGNDDGTFKPEKSVNRAELSAMWNRYDERVLDLIAAIEIPESAPQEGTTAPLAVPEAKNYDTPIGEIYIHLAFVQLDQALSQYDKFYNRAILNSMSDASSTPLLHSHLSIDCQGIQFNKDLAQDFIDEAKKYIQVTQETEDLVMDSIEDSYDNCLSLM